MRIGLLTNHRSPHLGAALQRRALFRHLEASGHMVEVINYIPRAGFLHVAGSGLRDLRATSRGGSSALRLSGPPIRRRSGLRALDDARYDAVFVAPGDLWADAGRRHDPSWLLDFLTPARTRLCLYGGRFIDADGFGPDRSSAEALLARFDGLSVSDIHSGEVLHRLTRRRPALVCDPMLLQARPRDLRPTRGEQGQFLLLAGRTTPSDAPAIRAFASAHGLRIVGLGRRTAPCDRRITRLDVDRFLDLLRRAALVVTDSHHTALGALQANRPLFVYGAPVPGALQDLLSQAKLEHLAHDSLGDLAQYSLDELRIGPDWRVPLGPMIARSRAFLASNAPARTEAAA